MLPYTVHVTPPLAALPKDDLKKTVFTPKLIFGELFCFKDLIIHVKHGTTVLMRPKALLSGALALQEGLITEPHQRRATCKEE